jgi:hypothetical protein
MKAMRARDVLCFAVLLLTTVFLAPMVGAQGALDEIDGELSDVNYDFGRWPYPLYAEVTNRLKELEARYPRLATLHSIGKTAAGRDMWLMEVTNSATGEGETKPGIWIDGNLHAHELNTRVRTMYFLERLLAGYGRDDVVTRLVDSRVFYVVPMFDADGGERALTRHPAWPEHVPSQHLGRDLNGDGFISSMRVKDPDGMWYASPRDDRVMLRLRARDDGRWNYVSTVYDDGKFFRTAGQQVVGSTTVGASSRWMPTEDGPPEIEHLAAPEERYSIYTEGSDPLHRRNDLNLTVDGFERNVGLDPPPSDFNRDWSAEWRPDEPGGGPFPFSLPETRAAAKFIVSHKNIYFQYNQHADQTARNYTARPGLHHPYDWMSPEDNEFYTRIGAVWSALGGGNIIENNYYSQEIAAGVYTLVQHGCEVDWAYISRGHHALMPEGMAVGRDYDGDRYVTLYEILRWSDEVKGGKFWPQWTRFNHPALGVVEIGGWRGMPPALDDRMRVEADLHYRFLLYIADLAPVLKIIDLTAEPVGNGQYRVVATFQNQGYLATYVSRKAMEIRRDNPILARLHLEGGEVLGGQPLKNAGHILGRHSYIWRWGAGADESTKTVGWVVRAEPGAEVRLEVHAAQAGRDSASITLGN